MGPGVRPGVVSEGGSSAVTNGSYALVPTEAADSEGCRTLRQVKGCWRPTLGVPTHVGSILPGESASEWEY